MVELVHRCRFAQRPLQPINGHAIVAQYLLALRHFGVRHRRRHLTRACGESNKSEAAARCIGDNSNPIFGSPNLKSKFGTTTAGSARCRARH